MFGIASLLTACDTEVESVLFLEIDTSTLEFKEHILEEARIENIALELRGRNLIMQEGENADAFFRIAFKFDPSYCPQERCFAPSALSVEKFQEQLKANGIPYESNQADPPYRFYRFISKHDYNFAMQIFVQLAQ